jgi:predicted metal-binding membrane protein
VSSLALDHALRRDRALVLTGLGGLVAVAWLYLGRGAAGMEMEHMPAGVTMARRPWGEPGSLCWDTCVSGRSSASPRPPHSGRSALLFVAGVMNLLWVAAITAFVLVEKALPRGEAIARGAGVLLVVAGLLMLTRIWI